MPSRLKIAIDGPAGAGKSTVARGVAQSLGYTYIDTGAMYRAIALHALRQQADIDDTEAMKRVLDSANLELSITENEGSQMLRVLLNGEDVTQDIRTQEVTRLVSPLSAVPLVREKLVGEQKRIASGGGVVLDGRDIGTVVLPDAELKIFLTASPRVRAERRLRDFQAIGEDVDAEQILKEIVERDQRDSSRAVGPLKKAGDAIELNTDALSAAEVISEIVALAEERKTRTCTVSNTVQCD